MKALVLLAAMSLSARAMAADKAPPDPQPPSDPQQSGNAGSDLRKAGKHLENAANDAAKTSREKLRKLGRKVVEETDAAHQDVKRGIKKIVQKTSRATRTNTTKVEPSTEESGPKNTR